MTDKATLTIGDITHEMPVVVGTENETAVIIKDLRSATGVITLDNGFISTGSCQSAITFLNGEQGVLRYRGYSIEELTGNSDFVEAAYLTIHGELPTQAQSESFRAKLGEGSQVHDSIVDVIRAFQPGIHPMAALGSATCALAGVLPTEFDSDEELEDGITKLMSVFRGMAAAIHRRAHGLPLVSPDPKLSYTGNFLRMMFGSPGLPYTPNPEVEHVLDQLLILHIDHEQNCSTSSVRLVGSSQATLYAAITGGVCALSGPLHGGANQAVIEMLQRINEDGGDVAKYVALAKDKGSSFRLMGFGHRVYKNYDPRALLIKDACGKMLENLGIDDPLLGIARRLETAAREDEYFVARKLYPNVDFYSGLIYRAIGIPTEMFTVMFALGRLPGWIAQWKEMIEDPKGRIGRPRQVYIGHNERKFVPMSERG